MGGYVSSSFFVEKAFLVASIQHSLTRRGTFAQAERRYGRRNSHGYAHRYAVKRTNFRCERENVCSRTCFFRTAAQEFEEVRTEAPVDHSCDSSVVRLNSESKSNPHLKCPSLSLLVFQKMDEVATSVCDEDKIAPYPSEFIGATIPDEDLRQHRPKLPRAVDSVGEASAVGMRPWSTHGPSRT